MTQHHLQGRTEDELLWFQRRGFLQAAAAWVAGGSMHAALADSASNIVEFVGDVSVNGQPLLPRQSVQTGDEIRTGPKSTLIFAIGNSAFHVRQNSSLMVERGQTLSVVSVLRLLQGAVVSVWGKGVNRQIIAPTLTAGLRGTGAYTEVFASQGNRSYFCNCYGVAELTSGPDRELSDRLTHALRHLTDAQREAIELAFYRGWTHDEIARTSGQPLGTVKSNLHRGLAELREVLEP